MKFLRRDCPGCSQPALGVCANCVSQLKLAGWYQPNLPHVNFFRAGFCYEGKLRNAILAAKHQARIDVLKQLGRLLAVSLCYDSLFIAAVKKVSYITWVPASKKAKRTRGFDQSKVIAKQLGKNYRIPTNSTLIRNDNKKQVGQTKLNRLCGPAVIAVPVPAEVVLLVDDVLTTGTSLNISAGKLLGSGVKSVLAVSLAAVI